MYKKVVATISYLLSEIIKKHDELRPKRLLTIFIHNPFFF
jgi:hypothetical protein